MDSSVLRIIPIGGVGTFGMNSMVVEFGDDMIVVDAGIKIPQGNMPGVDQILPDFSYVIENSQRVKAVFLTHGHDDHIAALPYLIRYLDVPVYGTAFTIALARARIIDNYLNMDQTEPDFVQLLFGNTVKCGSFSVETVRVSHSIPDCAALAITTPLGTVLHTGDFRMEAQTLDGHKTDLDRFRELGDEGILVLMADSTNSDRRGFLPPEQEVGKVLEEIISQAPGRVFIATFASHIHRVQMVLAAAHKLGRKVIMEGRRMVQNCSLAQQLGYLVYPPGTVGQIEDLNEKEYGDAVFLTTGTQGEPLAALSRIVRDEHRKIKITKGDTVVFSSRIIPGNELSVGQIINELFRKEVVVLTEDSAMVHVSGHSTGDEIKTVIEAAKPKYFIPLHGEYRQLTANANLAREAGVGADNIFILEPGNVLELSDKGAALARPVAAGRLLVDGDTVGDLDDELLRDRRRLAREGLVVVVAGVDMDGRSSFRPMVHSVGVISEESAEGLEENAVKEVLGILKTARSLRVNRDDLKEEIRIKVRGVFRRALKKKPRVVTVIIEE